MSAKKVVFTLVLQGCPWKSLFLHWFYKVVREKCCFYIGFKRVVREKREKAYVKTRFFRDNPPGTVLGHQRFTKELAPPTKIIEKALVFLGCPRKSLFLHWFYKVVREKACFYSGFTRLSAKNVVFTLVLKGLSAKNVKKPM